MRFLIDMPLTPLLGAFLRDLDHDAIHATDIGAADAADSTLLLRARTEARVVITAGRLPRLGDERDQPDISATRWALSHAPGWA